MQYSDLISHEALKHEGAHVDRQKRKLSTNEYLSLSFQIMASFRVIMISLKAFHFTNNQVELNLNSRSFKHGGFFLIIEVAVALIYDHQSCCRIDMAVDSSSWKISNTATFILVESSAVLLYDVAGACQ